MTWKSLKAVVPGIAVAVAAVIPCSVASAQAPSLEEQLAAQYKLVKMGSDTGGYSVVDPGTLLAIQKGGILGVPYTDKTVLTTKYEGGAVHSPNSLLVQGRKSIFGHFSQTQSQGQATHLFQTGEKVYPTKVEVNLQKDTVTMGIVACDTCNKTDPPTYNKAQVVFEFPKGTLAKASAGDVEDTIGQLLSISDDSNQGQGDQQGNDQQGGQQGQDQGQAQGQGQGQQGQQQQSQPETIQMGMTQDQVQATLGQPEKIVNLGPKQIFVYKDLKVTFFNGRVVDVQ
ncbi:MAG TPA: hypothetical protein VMU61_15160 [Candidatus Aquilonibacter sp.]|nr:hypothetical protein [Candidatus Aquilonibacter sp.]